MEIFDLVAEQRILEAIERGEFADLPGAGKPLRLDDDRLVPPELRMAYRVLKNAGLVPPEIELRREIGELTEALGGTGDDAVRQRGLARLRQLRLQLSLAGRKTAFDGSYTAALAAKLGKR